MTTIHLSLQNTTLTAEADQQRYTKSDLMPLFAGRDPYPDAALDEIVRMTPNNRRIKLEAHASHHLDAGAKFIHNHRDQHLTFEVESCEEIEVSMLHPVRPLPPPRHHYKIVAYHYPAAG